MRPDEPDFVLLGLAAADVVEQTAQLYIAHTVSRFQRYSDGFDVVFLVY
jgi:hypothetical protein